MIDTKIIAAAIIAIGLVLAVSINVYFDPYHACMRNGKLNEYGCSKINR